jgi:DNA modification methylase
MIEPYYDSTEGRIYLGSSLDVLKAMPDQSVHMCVTSPPYWGLRDYDTEPEVWDGDSSCDHVWGEGKKVSTGHNDGDRPQLSRGSYNGGGEDKYYVGKQEGSQGQFCQHCNAWRGSLGLEPTPELFVQHIVQIFSELKRVLRDDGTLWLNFGDSYTSGGRKVQTNDSIGSRGPVPEGYRSPQPPGLKPKDLVGVPWRVAFALQADGWYLRSDIIWNKPNPMPESVTDRPTKSHEYLFLLTKSQKYFYDAEAIKEPVTGNSHPRGHGVNPKAMSSWKTPDGWDTSIGKGHHGQFHRDGREKGKTGYKVKQNPSFSAAVSELVENRNKRTVWTIPTHPMPEAHFATFPPKLIEPCILAGTSEKGCCTECGAQRVRVVEKEYGEDTSSTNHIAGGDVTIGQGWEGFQRRGEVKSKTTGWIPGCECGKEPIPCTTIDPFFGSATTGIVSYKHGRKFIGIELSKTYLDDIAIPIIERETRQLNLFDNRPSCKSDEPWHDPLMDEEVV